VKRSGPFATGRATAWQTGGAGAAWNGISTPEELPIDGGRCGDRGTSSTSRGQPSFSSTVRMPRCQCRPVDELRRLQCQKEIFASAVSSSWYPSHLENGFDEHGDNRVSFLLRILSRHLYSVFQNDPKQTRGKEPSCQPPSSSSLIATLLHSMFARPCRLPTATDLPP